MISNAELFREIVQSKQDGVMTRRLAVLVMQLADELSRRSNWSRYTYLEDMRAEGIAAMVRGYDKFNEKKYSNAHSYMTSVCWNGFLRELKHHKKSQGVRDEFLKAHGVQPSFGAQVEQQMAASGMVLPPSEGVKLVQRRGKQKKVDRSLLEARLAAAERVLTGEEPGEPEVGRGK